MKMPSQKATENYKANATEHHIRHSHICGGKARDQVFGVGLLLGHSDVSTHFRVS